MSEKLDRAKGRVKEAAGDLADDDRLKREGKTDRVGAEIKETVEDLVDKAKNKIHDLTDRK